MRVKEFVRVLQGRPVPSIAAAVGRWLREGGPIPACVAVSRRWQLRRLIERAARVRSPRAGWTRRRIRECCRQPGARLDGSPGLLQGVTVLGLSSRNRRRYTPEAATGALWLYEGALVNLDHPDRPDGPRSVRDRFGRLVNVRFEGGRVRADLRYNPEHPFAATLEWFAENDPGAIGLSHNAVGEGKNEGGVFVVRKIVELRSVDLVAEPATSRGLFEGARRGR
jgi:hypothetical protein